MGKEQLDLATHLERPEPSRKLVEQDKELAVMVLEPAGKVILVESEVPEHPDKELEVMVLEPVDKVILVESEVLEHPDKELAVMVLEPVDKVILVESEVLEHPDKGSDPVSEDLEDTDPELQDPED